MSGRRGRRQSHVSPIYSIAVTWILFSMFFPIFELIRLVSVLVLSAVVFIAVSSFVKKKYGEAVKEEPEEEKEPEPTVSYGAQVDAVISEGKTAQKELGRLYASIQNAEVKKKIRDIMEISDKIIQDAINDPSDVPQIKKFLDYYLPTTIKLLNAYDRMGAQGIEGENISGTMSSIEEMLDTAIEAYRKLLDSLFANQALDIETDIDVMNTLLKREGLSGSSGL